MTAPERRVLAERQRKVVRDAIERELRQWDGVGLDHAAIPYMAAALECRVRAATLHEAARVVREGA